MNLRRKLLVLASLVLPLLSACGPVEDTDPNASLAGQHASVIISPEICPLSNESCPPGPTCDPVYDWGCEPCDRTNPAAWCYCAPGLITSSIPAYRGIDPYANPEVSSVGGTECNRMVITGIGARVVSDSDYGTLWIDYRQPYANGTLGPTIHVKTGPQSQLQPQRMVTADDGYAVVGLEVGQDHTQSVTLLKLYIRRFELTPSGVRMTGPTLERTSGTGHADQEATYFPLADNQVLVGLGLRSAVEQTKTLVAHVGTLP